MTTFNRDSTADELLRGIDLEGKRAVITGVSSVGLGVETARVLVAHGAEVIGTARDLDKAHEASSAVREAAVSSGAFNLIKLDLADLASVCAAADAIVAQAQPIDIVIASAGIMATRFDRTKDGFERQLATNVLGHYVLTNRLAPLMRAGARLVMISSNSHRFADVDLNDLNYERTEYEPWSASSRSKTGNALLAVAFDRRHHDRGSRARWRSSTVRVACALMPSHLVLHRPKPLPNLKRLRAP